MGTTTAVKAWTDAQHHQFLIEAATLARLEIRDVREAISTYLDRLTGIETGFTWVDKRITEIIAQMGAELTATVKYEQAPPVETFAEALLSYERRREWREKIGKKARSMVNEANSAFMYYQLRDTQAKQDVLAWGVALLALCDRARDRDGTVSVSPYGGDNNYGYYSGGGWDDDCG